MWRGVMNPLKLVLSGLAGLALAGLVAAGGLWAGASPATRSPNQRANASEVRSQAAQHRWPAANLIGRLAFRRPRNRGLRDRPGAGVRPRPFPGRVVPSGKPYRPSSGQSAVRDPFLRPNGLPVDVDFDSPEDGTPSGSVPQAAGRSAEQAISDAGARRGIHDETARAIAPVRAEADRRRSRQRGNHRHAANGEDRRRSPRLASSESVPREQPARLSSPPTSSDADPQPSVRSANRFAADIDRQLRELRQNLKRGTPGRGGGGRAPPLPLDDAPRAPALQRSGIDPRTTAKAVRPADEPGRLVTTGLHAAGAKEDVLNQHGVNERMIVDTRSLEPPEVRLTGESRVAAASGAVRALLPERESCPRSADAAGMQAMASAGTRTETSAAGLQSKPRRDAEPLRFGPHRSVRQVNRVSAEREESRGPVASSGQNAPPAHGIVMSPSPRPLGGAPHVLANRGAALSVGGDGVLQPLSPLAKARPPLRWIGSPPEGSDDSGEWSESDESRPSNSSRPASFDHVGPSSSGDAADGPPLRQSSAVGDRPIKPAGVQKVDGGSAPLLSERSEAHRPSLAAAPASIGQTLPPIRWETEPELPSSPRGPWIGFASLLAVALLAVVAVVAGRLVRRRDQAAADCDRGAGTRSLPD